ncbi:hypothetical protein ARMGADRAFT_1062908, partial [Armillaria gallica]
MRPLLLVWMLVVHFITLGSAQNLTPSSSWKEPNITSPKDDRISFARSALEKAVSMLQSNGQFNDSTYETPGRLYAQMAEFDRLTNQTIYKDILKRYFLEAESLNPGFLDMTSLSNGLSYGYAAARAYAAYQDPDFLDLAVTSWISARRYTISKEQATSGTTGVKQFSLSPSCPNQGPGATMAGGTFLSNDSNDTRVSSRASGLSALLAEATSNQTYLDAAIESATFIQSHLLNPSDVVLNYISSSCVVDQGQFPYNCGIFIEGLVILADMTHNASTESLLRSTIVAVTSALKWQGSNGIINTKTNGGHHVVRALGALYERNTTSSDLREYIKQYIGVQYNAVIKQSTSGSNIYGIPWTQLSSNTFNSVGQTVAISALLSSMQLVGGSSDNPTSSAIPSPSASMSPLPTKKTPTG